MGGSPFSMPRGSLHHVVLLVVLLSGWSGAARVEFQQSGIPNTESVLRLKRTLPELSAFSICFGMKPIHERPVMPLASYAVEGNHNEIRFALQGDKLVFQCCGTEDEIVESHKLQILRWTSMCISVDVSSSTVKILNGSSITSSKIASMRPVRAGGVFMIGQEQSQIGGGLDRSKSFRGIISDYLLLTRALSEEELRQYGSCSFVPDIQASLASFKDIEWDFDSGSDVKINDQSGPRCLQEDFHFVLFPDHRPFEDPAKWCTSLQGELPGTLNEQSILEEFQENACSVELCTICQFDEIPHFLLRGLCGASLFDRYYYLYGIKNGKPVFLGDKQSMIHWVPDEVTNEDHPGTWKLVDLYSTDTHALLKGSAAYPLHNHTWEVFDDFCEQAEVQFLLTLCEKDEFSCLDGSCIKRSKLCDQIKDCPEREDEEHCETAIVPEGYEKDMAPPETESGSRAIVRADLEIVTVTSTDLGKSEVMFEVILTRKWEDDRLTFRNLHESDLLNYISNEDGLWYPDCKFVGSDNSLSEMNIISKSMWAVRNSSPVSDNDLTVEEDNIFEGKSTSIVLEKYFTLTHTCQFNLLHYPFDAQECPIVLSMRHDPVHLAALRLDSFNFTGDPILQEYHLIDIVEESDLVLDDKSALRFTLKLQNQYRYYITAFYIPTLLLIFICYMTLYFDVADFNDRLVVSLTSLLVLAALFTQMSIGLPITSYLKLIDTWFVMCIIVSFIVVLIHVIVSCGAMSASSDSETWVAANKVHINNVGRISILPCIIIFIICYITYVVNVL